MEYKIETDIPIPTSRELLYGLTNVVRMLRVGESFLAPVRSQSTAHIAAKRSGFKIVTRLVDRGTIRIWKVAESGEKAVDA